MDKKRLLELAGMENPDYNARNLPDEENGEMGVSNETDLITLDVPLFIRLLEWAREDSENDMQLHTVAENAVNLSNEGKSLSMEDYEAVIASTENTDVEQSDMTGGNDDEHDYR